MAAVKKSHKSDCGICDKYKVRFPNYVYHIMFMYGLSENRKTQKPAAVQQVHKTKRSWSGRGKVNNPIMITSITNMVAITFSSEMPLKIAWMKSWCERLTLTSC